MTTLTLAQTKALEHVKDYAQERASQAQATLSHILRMSNISDEQFSTAVATLQRQARVALHFHPDRPNPEMIPVAKALLEQGRYKSQFETLLSNGSVSAYPGGARDLWEKQLFGGAYQLQRVRNRDRPKYGALDLMQHPDGPAPRFGSCYFLLNPDVSHRCTFTYQDSHLDFPVKGTYQAFDDIMAALMNDAFVNEYAIGERNLSPPSLVHHLSTHLNQELADPAQWTANRNLNHYIEAQVHGDISLAKDVDILVADPSFQGTEIGDALLELASVYQIDIFWHMGFALALEDVPLDFRGPTMPSLAARIANADYISTQMIGDAAMGLKANPDLWADRGDYSEVLQELKLLWHVLVKYGNPLRDVAGNKG